MPLVPSVAPPLYRCRLLGLPKRLPVPEVAAISFSKCGARNSETYNPIWASPDARVGGVGHYPDFIGKKSEVKLSGMRLRSRGTG